MNETQKVYKVEENRIFINGDGQITFLRSNTIEESTKKKLMALTFHIFQCI